MRSQNQDNFAAQKRSPGRPPGSRRPHIQGPHKSIRIAPVRLALDDKGLDANSEPIGRARTNHFARPQFKGGCEAHANTELYVVRDGRRNSACAHLEVNSSSEAPQSGVGSPGQQVRFGASVTYAIGGEEQLHELCIAQTQTPAGAFTVCTHCAADGHDQGDDAIDALATCPWRA